MPAVVIQEYESIHQAAFEQLNKAWLHKYFRVEPVDEYVLSQPDEAIIGKGGAILVALLEDIVVGVVALRKVDDSTFEFTKMAVHEQHHRKGIAEKLSLASFEKAKQLGGSKVILYTNSILEPAITLYKKLGFIDIPLDEINEYERSNVKMEIVL